MENTKKVSEILQGLMGKRVIKAQADGNTLIMWLDDNSTITISMASNEKHVPLNSWLVLCGINLGDLEEVITVGRVTTSK